MQYLLKFNDGRSKKRRNNKRGRMTRREKGKRKNQKEEERARFTDRDRDWRECATFKTDNYTR